MTLHDGSYNALSKDSHMMNKANHCASVTDRYRPEGRGRRPLEVRLDFTQPQHCLQLFLVLKEPNLGSQLGCREDENRVRTKDDSPLPVVLFSKTRRVHDRNICMTRNQLSIRLRMEDSLLSGTTFRGARHICMSTTVLRYQRPLNRVVAVGNVSFHL